MEFKAFKIGDYLILNRLAVGGMAAVYHGLLKGPSGFEKHLAIKRLLPRYTADSEFIEMFQSEARLNSLLTHPNIVQTFNYHKHHNNYYIAMEYLNGKDLKEYFNKFTEAGNKIPVASIVFIVSEILKGLSYAHTKVNPEDGRRMNIIHRDITPQNIMLTYTGEVKIIDFGIAKSRGSVEDTQKGVLKGKYSYLSPEQIREKEFDCRVDIFSTGIILYELVTGKRLFKADTEIASLLMIANGNITLPRQVDASIPEKLEQIIMKSLAQNPDDRFQSANEMLIALQEFAQTEGKSFREYDLAIILTKLFKMEIEAENKSFVKNYSKATFELNQNVLLEKKFLDIEDSDLAETIIEAKNGTESSAVIERKQLLKETPMRQQHFAKDSFSSAKTYPLVDWEAGLMYGAISLAVFILCYVLIPLLIK